MKNYSLEELLPHRAPMILVGGIESFDLAANKLTAWAVFDENSPFFVPELNGVPAYAGIELMAQATGLLSGIYALEIEKHPPRVGFLLGTRKYTNKIDRFEPGKKYLISVEQIFFQDGFGKTAAVITDSEGAPVADAELSLYLTQSENFEEALKKF